MTCTPLSLTLLHSRRIAVSVARRSHRSRPIPAIHSSAFVDFTAPRADTLPAMQLTGYPVEVSGCPAMTRLLGLTGRNPLG